MLWWTRKQQVEYNRVCDQRDTYDRAFREERARKYELLRLMQDKISSLERQLNNAYDTSGAFNRSLMRNQSRLWALENQIIQRDREIAVLKYQLANPTFGSTETAVVQQRKKK